MKAQDTFTSDQGICNGKPTIRGTRIAVETIVDFINAGTSDSEILHQYPILNQADLDACKSTTK